MFSLKTNPQKKIVLIALTLISLVMIGAQLIRYQYDGFGSGLLNWSTDDDAATVDGNPYFLPHNESHDHSFDEKFVTYLPYSRFSNQRGTLLNAALLAKYLNRTLIVPPLFLGSANGWSPAPSMYNVLANMTDVAWQDRCYDSNDQPIIEEVQFAEDGETVLFGCYNFTTVAQMPWSWATDLQRLTRSVEDGGLGIRIMERSNMALSALQDELGLPDDEMYLMQDSTRYQWRISDTEDDTHNLRYRYELSIEQLRNIQHRLLHFYGIFGYDRLSLHDEWNEEYRQRIEQSLIFRHHAIRESSSIILEQLLDAVNMESNELLPLDPMQAKEQEKDQDELPRFVAAHVRAGDGVFLKKLNDRVPEFVHQIWDIMTGNETTQDDLIGASNKPSASDPAVQQEQRQRPLYPLPKAPAELRDALHDLSLRERIRECSNRKQMILYVATDAPAPRTNPELQPILEAFPCTFFMDDFPADDWRAPLTKVRSPDDPHKDLTDLLIMFVDASICSYAERFVGTRTSTFSVGPLCYTYAFCDTRNS
ncbi:hypothetical protein BX666DRAFT_1882421 [Dichotomocladium elegans]|nr:hypothetical protein BX666DRAFT_1882421 [Dichotomocladium elegans]